MTLDIQTRRERAVRKNYYAKVLTSLTDEATNASVIVGFNNITRRTMAYYFNGRQINRCFAEKEVQSAHDVLALMEDLQDRLAAIKAEKTAPHAFEVGDIISATWGATMRRVDFYVVTDASKRRKVRLQKLKSQFISGDWMSGQEVPVLTNLPTSGGDEYATAVRNGHHYVNFKSSITTGSKWDGKPVSTYSD